MLLQRIFALNIFVYLSLFSWGQSILIDSNDVLIIKSIEFSGNKITRESIIRRELIINEGDTFASNELLYKKLQTSRENLLNTTLFNFVEYETKKSPEGVLVKFIFTERWYIWPVPIFEIADQNLNVWLKEQNWNRVNAGFLFAHNNFRGRQEKIGALLRFGYNQTYAIAYDAPYINSAKTLGISFVAGLNANHEVNTYTINNKPVYVKDTEKYLRREYFISLRSGYRKGINYTHTASLTYSNYTFGDTLLIVNPSFLPDYNANLTFTRAYYLFKADFRNYKSYPLRGFYADAELERYFFMNKAANFSSIKLTFRKYFMHSERWYSAAGICGRITEIKYKPYMLSNALGTGRDYVRGYEYYLVNGQEYVYAKTNIKYNLMKEKVFTAPYPKNEKFNKLPLAIYTNLFFDAGYVKDRYSFNNNSFSNRLLYGYGIGIDFLTYYDLVVRFEFSTNHMVESGFYLSLIAPI